MPFSETALQGTMRRLMANYPASFPNDDATKGVFALWAELLMAQTWVDDAILRRAVTQLILKEPGAFLPNIARVLEYLTAARDELEREARANAPALPPPQRREVDAIDPNDPYSCTPEERRRWAEEDAWLKQYAKRLPQTLTSDATPEAVDALTRNWQAVSRTELTPAARRAKERRIALERERAKADIERVLARAAAIRQEHKAMGRTYGPRNDGMPGVLGALDRTKAAAIVDLRASGMDVSAETGEVFRSAPPDAADFIPEPIPTRREEDEQDAQDEALLRAARVTWPAPGTQGKE